MALRRTDSLDFYYELGVAEDASQTEIREAFRALVRLIHPDRHADPELKKVAERHLRRINRIYSVLSDAERRRDYDCRLANASSSQEATAHNVPFRSSPARDPSRSVSRILWGGAAVILAGACLWLFIDGNEPPPIPMERTQIHVRPTAPSIARNSTIPQVSEAQTLQIEELESALRTARAERDTAKYEVARLRALNALSMQAPAAPNPSAAAPPAAPPSTEPVSASRSTPPPPPQPVPRVPRVLGSDPHQFAGFWFFAPPVERTDRNLYPPQFIEANLTEKNGVVHGTYRSRYRIADRAISPDVNFEFSGPANGTTVVALWAGPGGARGQLTLTLANENSMKFDWTASDVGTLQGLASGTATLTRRIE